jgi:cysteine desulfurase family protein (TIGR01976 family)
VAGAGLTFDVAAARARFSALDRDLVFLDAPGGTQVPDEVISAIAGYLRHSNANTSGPYETSRRTEELFARARVSAARFLGCSVEEVIFGPNMTSLNFTLSRTVGRSLEPGDEIVVTRLDHDANVAPWLELARDRGLAVRFADIRDDSTLDLDDLERQLSERTRIVAFPLASNAVGTLTDVRRIAALAHEAGALAWGDAVHFAPHAHIDVSALGVDVLVCSPYKFFGPHLGLAFGRRELLEGWRPYKVRPQADEPLGLRFETGTQPYELLAGLVAAVEYVESIGWEAIIAWERALGERFVEGLPATCRLLGLPTMDGRVPTFAFTLEGLSPAETAARLGERGFAVWHGNYYALEVMKRLGLENGGAVRVGFVHYNTLEEVDRLLEELARLE